MVIDGRYRNNDLLTGFQGWQGELGEESGVARSFGAQYAAGEAHGLCDVVKVFFQVRGADAYVVGEGFGGGDGIGAGIPACHQIPLLVEGNLQVFQCVRTGIKLLR